MAIGEKIRHARQEAGLSQRQLCGDRITRNMLSQIENGSARPSMDTLRYLAQQLSKPVSFFLDEDTLSSPNQALMVTARTAFAAGDFVGALDVLGNYHGPDDAFDPEKGLLQNLCLLAAAQQAQVLGKTPFARQLLDRVDKESIYYTAPLRREHHLLAGTLPPADDRELLLRAENALSMLAPQRATEYLTAAENWDAPQWNLLCGNAHFAQKDYKNAIPYLQKAESADPRACIAALETCFRELGDYENAYRYACKLREL